MRLTLLCLYRWSTRSQSSVASPAHWGQVQNSHVLYLPSTHRISNFKERISFVSLNGVLFVCFVTRRKYIWHLPWEWVAAQGLCQNSLLHWEVDGKAVQSRTERLLSNLSWVHSLSKPMGNWNVFLNFKHLIHF